jgi:hypothetical protein
VTVYTRVKLARPYRHDPFVIDALDFCVGQRSEQATVLHVRGRCDGDVAFAGCLVLSEGRDEPEHDLLTYGQPRDTDALAAAIEACLVSRTTVIRDEMRRIGG